MAPFKLDPDQLPTLTADQCARLDALTDADIMAAAMVDADNPPLTEDETMRIRADRAPG